MDADLVSHPNSYSRFSKVPHLSQGIIPKKSY
jgi:hypothetical protein